MARCRRGCARAHVPDDPRHRVLALGARRPRGPLGLQAARGGAKRGNGGAAPSCLRAVASSPGPYPVKIMFASVLNAASLALLSGQKLLWLPHKYHAEEAKAQEESPKQQ